MNFTVSQLAQRWSCSDTHIRNLIQERKLRAFRIGNRRGYRITQNEVEQWESRTAMETSNSEDQTATGLPISFM